MKHRLLAWGMTLLFSGASLAVLCTGTTSKDLSSANGSLFPLRVTDQDDLGICHLEQLHKLLQAKMSTHPDFSRFQMGLMEKKMRDRNLPPSQKKAVRWWKDQGKNPGGIYIDAGSSCAAYELIKGQAICEASKEKLEKMAFVDPKTPTSILNSFSAYFDKRSKFPLPLQLDRIAQVNTSCEGDPNPGCISETFSKLPPLDPNDLLSSGFYQNFVLTDLNLVGQTVPQIQDLVSTEDRDVFFDKALGSCEGEKIVVDSTLSCRYDDLQEQYKLQDNFDTYAAATSQVIDALVDEGTPIGISICTRMFKTPTAETIRLKTGEFTCGNKNDPGYRAGEGSHAVVIIGNRCVNGQKEYLIQNSWGSGCSYYDSSYS